MRRRFEVTADSGLVVLHDAELPAPCLMGRAEEIRKVLKSSASDGGWFYLDGEDPVSYRIDLIMDEEPTDLPAHRFQRLGGTFKLRLDSGRLAVSAFEDWSARHGSISVPAGTYALTVRGAGDFDREGYEREYRGLLGDADWRFRERIDRIGIAGCLSAMAAVVLVVLPLTRPLWYLPLAAITLGWGPHLLLRLTRRYRDIDRRIREHERSLPHFVVQLTPSQADAPIDGGYIVTANP
jgi:hypothetical protein